MLLSWWNHLDSFLGNIVRGPMDFNLKSKLWAGNIYQQFESICHDVDEFVNKDTVKFVGNQVQNVGISVKRLYSNVVQDVLPLSGNIVKPERQAGEQGDMQDRVSVTGIRTTSTCTDEKQLPKNQVSDDHKMQISKPANTPESQTCQYFRDNVNAIVQNSDAEKTVTKDLKSVTANSSFDGEIFSRKCDEDYISSSPIFSADGEGSTSIEKERRYCNYQKVDKGFSDGMGFYETSSNGWLSKSMLSVFEDPYFDGNGSLSSPPLPVSTHRVNNVHNCPLIDMLLPPACDVDDWASEKDRALCGSCYTKHESVDLSTSDLSSEQPLSYHSYNEKEQILIMPSTYCASPKSPITVESTSADFSKKVENVLHSRSVSDSISAASSINDADTTNEAASADFSKKAENVLHSRSVSDGCTYNISAASSVNAADTKALDVEPFFPILESNDNNALQTDRPDILIGSSESRQEEHYREGRSKIVISPSETENTYKLSVPIGDLDLESIDLSSNSMHDRRSVVMNSNFVLAGSYRRRNFRYYKNIIKGAFTSQKRLAKEYEHLAIMYGDIDVESNQHFEPSSLCSFPNTALHVAGTRSSQEMKDEWELL